MIFNELRRSSLGRALKTALGAMDGALERFGETLTPTIDLWARPEWALLRDEELFGTLAAQAAGGVGTFAKVGVFNPAGSNLLVVVLRHSLSLDVAARVELFPIATPLGNTGTVQMLDRRRRLSHGAVVHFEASAAAGADQLAEVNVGQLLTQTYDIPIVLPPGQGFMWRNEDDNANLIASFVGYQRHATNEILL